MLKAEEESVNNEKTEEEVEEEAESPTAMVEETAAPVDTTECSYQNGNYDEEHLSKQQALIEEQQRNILVNWVALYYNTLVFVLDVKM